MKKLLLTLVLTMIFTTGCVKTDTIITFDNKGNAVVENNFLINKELGTYEKIDTIFEDIRPVDNENIKTEKTKITEDEMIGAKYTTAVSELQQNDLKDVVRILKPQGDRLLTVEKNFFYDKYRFSGYIEGFKSEKTIDVNINDLYQSKIRVKLPCKPKSHNAQTLISDKELVWQIDYTKDNSISLEFILLNYLTIGLTTLAAVLLICLGVFIIKSKFRS